MDPTTTIPPKATEMEQRNNKFTLVNASELFPKPRRDTLMRINDDAVGGGEDDEAGFQLVPGEAVVRVGPTASGGRLSITNYRLHEASAATSEVLLNVPLGLIELAEIRDLFHIHLFCKDGRYYRISMETNASAEEWARRINQDPAKRSVVVNGLAAPADS